MRRFLLVDDHAIFTEGLEMWLEHIDKNIFCESATSIAAALQCPGPFELVLLDYSLPDSRGMEGLEKILSNFDSVPVVVLSGESGSGIVHEAIARGASGFIPKSFTGKEIFSALEIILRGGIFLPSYALEGEKLPSPPALAELGLTERQADCLVHLALGKQNKVIAREMGLSDNTVKAHLSAAFKALGVSNRAEAVMKVARLGIFLSDRTS